MSRKRKSSVDDSSPPDSAKPFGRYWLPQDAKWGGFLNIRLTDAQKQEFRDWEAVSAPHVFGFLEDAASEGMKVGAAYDAENEAYIVTYTGALVSNSNERYCCTSRGGSLAEALSLAVWKHEVLAMGTYDNYNARTGEFMRFG